MTDRTLYEILGVEREATTDEIRVAYRSLARLHHPDAGGDPDEFIALTSAYNVLSNPKLRDEYDLTGKRLDRRAHAAQEYIIELLSSTLDKILNDIPNEVDETDVIGLMKRMILQAKANMEAQERELTRNIRSMHKLRARISRKGEQKNLFAEIFDRRSREKGKKLAEITEELYYVGRAIEELSHYKSIVDVVRFVQAGVYRADGASTNSFWGAITVANNDLGA